MEIDPIIRTSHTQLDEFSCIPMSIEYVLKLLGRVPRDWFVLQFEWKNKKTRSFADFHEREIEGLKFRQQFAFQRGGDFPLNELFRTIDSELAASRYVIISLSMPGGWHNFVIHEHLPDAEYI